MCYNQILILLRLTVRQISCDNQTLFLSSRHAGHSTEGSRLPRAAKIPRGDADGQTRVVPAPFPEKPEAAASLEGCSGRAGSAGDSGPS